MTGSHFHYIFHCLSNGYLQFSGTGLHHCQNFKKLNAHMCFCGPGKNIMVRMYSEHGNLKNARQVFDKMSKRIAFPWNTILREYAWNEPYDEALTSYSQMQSAGICPDSFTYAFALKACAALSSLPQGKRIHGQIVVRGFESHVFVITAVIDMYVKCSSIEDARQVFDKMRCRDVVSWNAMIAGYAQHGRANEALVLFYKMRCEDVMPELATMVHVLPAFAELGNLRLGKCVHEYIVRNEFGLDRFVGSSLIDMYARCGGIEVARQLFDKMSQRDVVSWTAMIAGYAQNGYAWKALTLFHQMLREKIMPNSATIASAISACGDIGALEQGKWIHDYISKKKLELDVFVATSLIDMYAKCCSLEVARQLFDKMVERDVVSRNCMITGYGLHGHGKDALEHFFQMQGMGVKPNNITFNNILSACRRAHLVNEACQFFDCMTQNYHIDPDIQHCLYMFDPLGCVGRLNEALTFIKKMPIEPDAGVRRALLHGYKIHKDIELRECVS